MKIVESYLVSKSFSTRSSIQRKIMTSSFAYGITLMVAIATSCCLAQNRRQNPEQEINLGQDNQPTILHGNISCGSSNDLAARVEICAAPLMDIIQGTIEVWPKNDLDVSLLCHSFLGCERCIRENSRKCAKGLQRTITSTVANSIQRVRKRECNPKQYQSLLKTTQCIENNQKTVRALVSNATSYLRVVEAEMRDLDKKTSGVCCMVHDIENSIKSTLNPICPEETKVVVKLYRAVLEDVIDLICPSPKCNDVFRGYRIKKTQEVGGIIAILLRIVFSLG